MPFIACQLKQADVRRTVMLLTQSDVERTMLSFLLWLLLLFLCWPLALLALVLYPVVWLLTLPLRLVGIGVEAVFELLRAIVMLPARVLGGGTGR